MNGFVANSIEGSINQIKISFIKWQIRKIGEASADTAATETWRGNYNLEEAIEVQISADKCDLLVRWMKTRFGDRVFSVAGPRC